ncbi:hypothetical protein B9Z55_013600 [Caenorhabditis nigoni]|uniref:Carboxylesterase type B domain-containing protein n=1 Tax=Caenorhabditis nigoni TaxID=1611254 RepID=A0A2G5U2E7_9PELO|nr:hypothetical protein B9Z55_013600 [Caenorhabditis nigoni]
MVLNSFYLIYFLSLISSLFAYNLSTSYGILSGWESGNYYLFKHVPFAKPPIGELRFQKPETPEKWNDVRDATEYGPACMSNSTTSKSVPKSIGEDCLHLNIFTSRRCLSAKNCSVVVYIHGGDILYDSAVMFNDTHILDTFVKNDVILVIPAFRLGIFSHFTVEDQSISPTNLAFYDILKSLDYVKSEIHNFGGSNQKVTLFGHSYGGTMTTMMTFSPRINQDKSLFQKTVVMSSHQNFQSLRYHIERTRVFADHANCVLPSKLARKMTKNQQDSYTLKCLQSKSGHELLRIQRSLEESGYSTFGGVVRREPLFTEVHPSEYMNTPNQIPMLTGCNKHEMDFLPGDMPIAHMFGYENSEECEEKYRYDLKHGKYDRENHTDKTIAMLVPTKIRVNKLLEKNIPTYFYQLRYPKHSYHTDDLYYAMGVHPFEMDENEIHLKEVYQQMIINFVKFENPGNGFELADMKTSSYFEINWNETTGLRPHMSTGFEKKMMDYWLGEMVAFDKNISEQKRKTPNFKFSGIYLNPNIADQSSSPMFFVIFVISVACLGYFLYKECYTGDQKRVYIRIDGRDYNTVKQSEMMVY